MLHAGAVGGELVAHGRVVVGSDEDNLHAPGLRGQHRRVIGLLDAESHAAEEGGCVGNVLHGNHHVVDAARNRVQFAAAVRAGFLHGCGFLPRLGHLYAECIGVDA